MFPHPDLGKDLYYPKIDGEQIRCGWRAAMALVLAMAGAALFDLAAEPDTQADTVVAATLEGGR